MKNILGTYHNVDESNIVSYTQHGTVYFYKLKLKILLFKNYIYMQENYRKGIMEMEASDWWLSLCGGEDGVGGTVSLVYYLSFRGMVSFQALIILILNKSWIVSDE